LYLLNVESAPNNLLRNIKNTQKFDINEMKEVEFVRHEELIDLLELYNHLHENDLNSPGKDKLEEIWEDIVANPLLNYFVIKKNKKFVSSCTLTIIPNLTRGGRPYGLIENVVTHVNFRRKGYGTMILKKALQYAREQKCYKVMLLTGSKERGIFEFYIKAGFKKDIKTGFIAQNLPIV
jgi:GNAT superfamily N-acetyltransferase